MSEQVWCGQLRGSGVTKPHACSAGILGLCYNYDSPSIIPN